MRYFFDCEFLEDGKTIELISIGIVCEDGREYYAVNDEMPLERIEEEPWLVANVLPHLPLGFDSWRYCHCITPDLVFRAKDLIRQEVVEFVTGDDVEFWAYFGDYDWVCLCQLFGRMIYLPSGWPMFAYDLRQSLNERGLAHIKQPDDAPHHALEDARWIRDTYTASKQGKYCDANA